MNFELLMTYPELTALLVIIGLARVINKPLFTLLHLYIAKTKTKEDDEFFAQKDFSLINKFYLFLLDWLLSIKPHK